MDIEDLRQQIDAIDAQIVACFCKRMEISGHIAKLKQENNLPIFVPDREDEVLRTAVSSADPELREYVYRLYQTILSLSKTYQKSLIQTPVAGDHSDDDEVI
jgi:monofunctional chorismate mutase